MGFSVFTCLVSPWERTSRLWRCGEIFCIIPRMWLSLKSHKWEQIKHRPDTSRALHCSYKTVTFQERWSFPSDIVTRISFLSRWTGSAVHICLCQWVSCVVVNAASGTSKAFVLQHRKINYQDFHHIPCFYQLCYMPPFPWKRMIFRYA